MTQLGPAQQPNEQLFGPHGGGIVMQKPCPGAHDSPDMAQSWHCAPLMPHAVSEKPIRHALL
jgi:hypothetical protein